MKEIVGWIVAVVLIAAAIFGVTAYMTGMYAVFAPVHEEIRSNVILHSRAHMEDAARTLRDYKIQWTKEQDPATKALIARRARDEYSMVNINDLPSDIQPWFSAVRNGDY